MPDRDNTPDVTALTVQLLSVYLTNNPVASQDFADLVRSTRAALSEDLARPATDSSDPRSGTAGSVSDGGEGLSGVSREGTALRSAPKAKVGRRKVKTAAPVKALPKASLSPNPSSPPDAGVITGSPPPPLSKSAAAAVTDATLNKPSTKAGATGSTRNKAAKEKSAKAPGAATPSKSSRKAAAALDGATLSNTYVADVDSPASAQPESGASLAADRSEQPVTSSAAAPEKGTTNKVTAVKSKSAGKAAGASRLKRRTTAAAQPGKADTDIKARRSVRDDKPTASSAGAEVADKTVSKGLRGNRSKPSAEQSKPKREAMPSVTAQITSGPEDKKNRSRGKLSLFAQKSAEKPSDPASGAKETLASSDAPIARVESSRRAAKPKRMARPPAVS